MDNGARRAHQAGVGGGGPSRFIATWLFATSHSSRPIAFFVLLTVVIGIGATAMLTDYTNKDISEEYAAV